LVVAALVGLRSCNNQQEWCITRHALMKERS
jgi:hypothetical protein